MRKKTLTMDCDKCNLMKVNEEAQFVCRWGNGKPKLLEPHKGRKPINCRLKR